MPTPIPKPTVQEQVAELVRNIHKEPNPLHNEYSEGVSDLIKFGEPVIDSMFDLLNDKDYLTRLRAANVIENVALNLFYESTETKKFSAENQLRWDETLGELGSLVDAAEGFLDETDSRQQEKAARIARWRVWLVKHKWTSRKPFSS